jgi:hypothetical protein
MSSNAKSIAAHIDRIADVRSRQLMKSLLRNYVNGEWVDTGRKYPNINPVDGSMTDLVSRAAVALWEASRSGVACAPVRTLIGESDTDTAYAVQEHTNSDNSGLWNSNSAATSSQTRKECSAEHDAGDHRLHEAASPFPDPGVISAGYRQSKRSRWSIIVRKM